MCVGLWSLAHPDYALILCSNRDEYLSRPTVNAHFHSFDREPNDGFILSGRDVQAGGSWFGINRAGRVALLTNISEHDEAPHRESRGHLVASFLLPDAPDSEHLDWRSEESSMGYAGFNLALFTPLRDSDTGALRYEASLITNHGSTGAIASRSLVHEELEACGMSNGVDSVDGKSWPKVKTGVARLKEILYRGPAPPEALSDEQLAEKLFEILALQSESAPGNRFQLRNSIQIPPLRMSPSLHPSAEPSDRHDSLYGTRVSTILLITRDDNVLFIERDIWKLSAEGQGQGQGPVAIHGDPREARVYRFRLDDK